jgi:hypothetical protein
MMHQNLLPSQPDHSSCEPYELQIFQEHLLSSSLLHPVCYTEKTHKIIYLMDLKIVYFFHGLLNNAFCSAGYTASNDDTEQRTGMNAEGRHTVPASAWRG